MFSYSRSPVISKPYDSFSKKSHQINRELQASFYVHAILGMITEWINHGFEYDSN
ncbi:TetR-like C-terminal domain-containing protein [Cytobacillus oceanisediminis]|uniref:TetR-like C-terminal domain-containing protein n=1 Tax=Cytobacillus oceanisediminis TaxID=665099 RepID=UPI003D2F64EC